MNVQESLNNIEVKKQTLRENKNVHGKTETELVIAVITHCHEHNCPKVVMNTVDYLADWGTKDGKRAFVTLNKLTTGAYYGIREGEAENTPKRELIDSAKQTLLAATYKETLQGVSELGLSDWFKGLSSEAKGKKSKEQALAEKKAKAIKVLTEVSLDPKDADSVGFAAMLEYSKAYAALAKHNPSAAEDMHRRMVNDLVSAMTKQVQRNLESLKPTPTSEAA